MQDILHLEHSKTLKNNDQKVLTDGSVRSLEIELCDLLLMYLSINLIYLYDEKRKNTIFFRDGILQDKNV